MHCLELQEWMSLKLDGRLLAEEQSLFEAHLRECPACARVWQQWQEIDSLFAGAPMARPPVDLAARVLARVERRRHRGALGSSLLVLALGLAVLAAVYVLPALGGFCLVGISAAQTPSLWATLVGVVAHFLEIVVALGEACRLTLWAAVSSRSILIAIAYAILAAATLATWLRVVVFRVMLGRDVAG